MAYIEKIEKHGIFKFSYINIYVYIYGLCRYADDTILMEESKDELKSFLIRVKEESEKAGLKLNIKKPRSWHQIP